MCKVAVGVAVAVWLAVAVDVDVGVDVRVEVGDGVAGSVIVGDGEAVRESSMNTCADGISVRVGAAVLLGSSTTNAP